MKLDEKWAIDIIYIYISLFLTSLCTRLNKFSRKKNGNLAFVLLPKKTYFSLNYKIHV